MGSHKFLSLLSVALMSFACTDSGSFSTSVVDIDGGRKMYLECDGAGSPTVLLVSGKGDRADIWRTNRLEPRNVGASVLYRTARFTRVCAYDRLTADLPPISPEDVKSGAFPPFVTVEFVNALWSAQIAAQKSLAKLFPSARHITDTNSRHYIHLEQPQLVVDAIREVVDAVRR
jgi:pimeloyl-ACP methyl ester carboxylesterase